MRSKNFPRGIFLVLKVAAILWRIVIALATVASERAPAQTEAVLHSFSNNGKEGYHPICGLIFDADGNLYGTTSVGGANNSGTVFELSPKAGGGWVEKVLHTFIQNGTDGIYPEGALIFDGAGNLYGTTTEGGANFNSGAVFQLIPSAGGVWTETVIHSFSVDGNDGRSPRAGLISDAFGSLYGTTAVGGTHDDGTVFELTPVASGGWTETVLHDFDGSDGAGPLASLVLDAAGNLYGTTSVGGANGFGTVFELAPNATGGWMQTVLHNFNNKDGHDPLANLIFDAAGNLYGTTSSGGNSATCGTAGCGTVFELTPKLGGGWTESVLHTFNDITGGYAPFAGLIFDPAGNLYGTTSTGGRAAGGTVFKLTLTGNGWTEKVLRNFNGKGGSFPDGGVIFDSAGNLYGTTVDGGGFGDGTVFEIEP